MEITVRDFCYMCIEPAMQTVNLWNCETGKEVWSGTADEIPGEYAGWYVGSWDCISEGSTAITINITES